MASPKSSFLDKVLDRLGRLRVRRVGEHHALERAFASRRPWVIDVPVDLSVGSYFTKGIDRAYPDKWAKSYPSYNLLRNVEN